MNKAPPLSECSLFTPTSTGSISRAALLLNVLLERMVFPTQPIKTAPPFSDMQFSNIESFITISYAVATDIAPPDLVLTRCSNLEFEISILESVPSIYKNDYLLSSLFSNSYCSIKCKFASIYLRSHKLFNDKFFIIPLQSLR